MKNITFLFTFFLFFIFSDEIYSQAETEPNGTAAAASVQIISAATTVTGDVCIGGGCPINDPIDYWSIADGSSGTLIATWSDNVVMTLFTYATAARNTAPSPVPLSSGASQTLSAASFYSVSVQFVNFGVVTSYSVALSGTSLPASNAAPTDITLSNNSINQSATGVNVSVGTFTTTDGDAGDSHTYSLVSGIGDTNNGNFNISGNALRTSSTLTAGDYSVRINTNDATDDFAKVFSITVVDNVAPSGHSVVIDQIPINAGNDDAVSFTFASAEVGATYNYTFTSSGGAGSVTGSGVIATATDKITGVDLSGLTDGTITLSVTLTDVNINTGSAVTDTELKDVLAPSGYSVNIDQSSINETNVTAVSFTFAAAEVGASYNFSFTSNGGSGSISGSGAVATATDQLTGFFLIGLPDGTITLSVTLTDVNGNTSTAAIDTKTKGTVAPTVSSTSPTDDATDVGITDDITLTFSENIAFGTGSIQVIDVTDGSNSFTIDAASPGIQASISGSVLTINPSSDLDEESNYAVQIAATAIDGLSGNSYSGITNNTTLDFTTADETTPRITSILRQTPATSPTNADALTFRVTFDENVQGVGAADFVITGATGVGIGVVGSSATYDVTLSGGDLAVVNSTITLGFAGGQNITDESGNALVNLTPTGTNNNTFVIDNDAPRITSILRQTPATSPTNGDALTFRITFDENVQGVSAADFVMTGATGVGIGVVGSSATYDITFSGGDLASLNATVTLGFAGGQNIADASGNGLTNLTPTGTNNNTFEVNNIAPSFSSASPSSSSTVNNANVGYTVSEALASGTVTYIRTGGTADGSSPHTATLTGSELSAGTRALAVLTNAPTLVLGAIYTISFDGTDAAGNTATTVNVTNVTFGTVEPTSAASSITFSSITETGMTVGWTNGNGARRIVVAKSGSAVSADPVDGTTGYSANAALGSGTDLGNSNYIIYDGTGTSVAVTGLSSTTSYHYKVIEVNGSGATANYYLTGAPTANQASQSPPVIITSIIRQTPTDASTGADQVVFRVTFGKGVINVDTSDFALSGTSAGDGTISTITPISTSIYDVTVTGITSSNGTLNLDIKGNDGVSGSNNITELVGSFLSQTTTGNTIANAEIGQSFTASSTGNLIDVTLYMNVAATYSGAGTLEIRSGDGLSGSVLATEAVTFVDQGTAYKQKFAFTTPAAVTSGNVYTIRITGAFGSALTFDALTGDPFAGGIIYIPTALASADLTFEATISTGAGALLSTTAPTTDESYILDNNGPTLTSSNPADDAIGVVLNQDITLTFNENISKGIGNILIKKTSDNSTIETIDVTTAVVTVSTTTATINPSSDFDLNTGYYIQIDNTAFKDALNNNYAGIADATSLNFTSESNQTNSFTEASGSWSIPSNWSLGRLPISTDNVNVGTKTINLDVSNVTVNDLSISIGGAFNILNGRSITINGNLAQNGTLNILSNASSNGSLIVKGNHTGISNVDYHRYLSTNWHLVAAPVQGKNISDFSGNVNTSGNKYAIAPYINNVVTTSRWNYYTGVTGAGTGVNPLTTAGAFTTGKGYSMQKNTGGTLNFSGTLNTTDKTFPITDGGDNPAGNRWNLVGNPYTASLNGSNAADAMNNFLKVNIDAGNLDPSRAGLYLWDGTAYVEKSVDDAAFYIAPGQGFFVHAPDAGGTSVSFTEAMETHQTGDIFLRGSGVSYPEIVLNVTEDKNSSSTKIRYINNKTKGLDPGSDVGTFTGTNSSFKAFTHLVNDSKGIDFAIQALPNQDYENIIVPVGLKSKAGKTVKFSAKGVNLPNGIEMYLEDRDSNTFTNLSKENYTITLRSDSNGSGQFFIHTSAKRPDLITSSLESTTIYKSSKSELTITGLQTEKASLTVFSILGKKVMIKEITSSNGNDKITLPKIAAGVYIVELTSELGKISKKIILE